MGEAGVEDGVGMWCRTCTGTETSGIVAKVLCQGHVLAAQCWRGAPLLAVPWKSA